MLRHWCFRLGLAGFVFAGLFIFAQTTAQAEITLTPVDGKVMVNVAVRKRFFRRAQEKGARFFLQLWSRDVNGWRKAAVMPLATRKLTQLFPLSRFCAPSEDGRKRIAAQLGLQWQGYWRNRYTQQFQRDFSALQQEYMLIRCMGSLPNDPPPGTHVGGNNEEPADLPAWDAPGATPPPVAPPPVLIPRPAPAMLVVPEERARRFRDRLLAERIESRRVQILGGWLQRRREQNMFLTARSIRRFIKVFSFDTNKLNVTRVLARRIATPYYAREIASILQLFQFEMNRQSAALFFCRGIADPQNFREITSLFNSRMNRRALRARCR